MTERRITDWMEDIGMMDGYGWIVKNQKNGWEYIWKNCPSAGFYFGCVEFMVGEEGWPSKSEYVLFCCDVVDGLMKRYGTEDKLIQLTLKCVRSFFTGESDAEKLGEWADVMHDKWTSTSVDISGRADLFVLTWVLAHVGNLSVHSEFSDDGDVYDVIKYVRDAFPMVPSPALK